MEIVPVAQEYVGIDEGEFTIGVLSLPDTEVVASIALRRALDAKLSVAYRGRGGIISSGYSQGYIDNFPSLCAQAEKIAAAIDSRGPINVQGRVREGQLLPFEINPRFSASSHLRAMAGFNEVELLLRYHISGIRPERPKIRPGWYLRSLTESFIPSEAVDKWSTG
jgi:carbamoyl-phosphate synthase large subunit